MKTDRSQLALSRFKEGFSCSQSVLSAYSDIFALDPNLALKISQAFGGGIARRGEICGAVSGAFMVIGLKYGRTRADDTAARDKTYEVVNRFIHEFRNLHGFLNCKELLGCDLSTEEGHRRTEEEGLFENLCPKFVRDASDIVGSLI